MTNSTSLFDQQMRESRDPFSATNMMNKNMMNSCAKKLYKSRFNLTDTYFKIVFNNISSDFSLLSDTS
ncbi:MAG: hypothetical protein ACRDDW_03415 [Candidatus Rhabdochlamydia sp.]